VPLGWGFFCRCVLPSRSAQQASTRAMSSGWKTSVMGLGSWPGTGSLAWTSCWTMTAAMSSRVTSFCRGSSGVCRRASIWKPSLFRPLEQLLDGPTTAIKAGPVEGVFGRGQLAGGDQPPVQRRRVRRSVDLAHIHQRHAHRPGQARAGGSVARPGQIHLDPPHGHLRGPGLAAASSRQLQRLASGFQQGVEPGEQKSAIVQRAVLRGPNQHLHARQRLRQGLVDVALAIGDHRHPPRRRSTPPHQPPPASDGSPSPRRARSCAARGAPLAVQMQRLDQSQQRPVLGVHRDHRMQAHPPPPAGSARMLVVSWIARTCRPAQATAVRNAAEATISPTSTAGFSKNRLSRISPARWPPAGLEAVAPTPPARRSSPRARSWCGPPDRGR